MLRVKVCECDVVVTLTHGYLNKYYDIDFVTYVSKTNNKKNTHTIMMIMYVLWC